MKFYVLHVVGDVDPELLGPFADETERDNKAAELFKETGGEDGVFAMDIDANGIPSVLTYSSTFAEDAMYGKEAS